MFTKLNKNQLSEIRALENSVVDKKYYTLDDDDFFNHCLFNNGIVLGLYNDNRLKAVSGSFILSSYEYSDFFTNLLFDLGFSVNPSETVFFNNTIVDAENRGQGLQKKFRKETIKYFKDQGIKQFISTTSLNNIGSFKSLEKIGMVKIGEVKVPYSDQEKNLYLLTL